VKLGFSQPRPIQSFLGCGAIVFALSACGNDATIVTPMTVPMASTMLTTA
jgi:hypothetical protein